MKIYKLAAAADGTLWASGNGVVQRSRNGTKWARALTKKNVYFGAMHWPDDGESMLLGATGSISRLAGRTLKKVFDTKGRFVHAFAAGPNGLLFAVGRAGLVLRSGDGAARGLSCACR